MTEKKEYHRGVFVGGYLTEEQVGKIEAVAAHMDGDPGRNRTRALRWIIDCFDPAWIEHFPKTPALQVAPATPPAPGTASATARQQQRSALAPPPGAQTPPTDPTQQAAEAARREELLRQAASRSK